MKTYVLRHERLCRLLFPLFCAALLPSAAYAQKPGQNTPAGAADTVQQQTSPNLGQKDSKNDSQKKGTDPSANTKKATLGNGDEAASPVKLSLGPLDPSTAPADLPHNRPVIGLAMGGGAALAMSEIGTLEWLEQHRIPVDVIAGTSMGSILAALYSTGKTPEHMKHILTDENVNRVFRIQSDYSTLSFRRREDERELPNALGVGLKHGPALRNSLLTDVGLNELLDKEFLNYNDQTDFNNLPIPFRCQATDLNDARTVTFARGSLQNAVRASASIPGVFRPFTMDGHEYVDGAILQNLPTADVRAMHADVIIAISLPLEPVGKGDLNSILGVLSRAFAVGIEANEARDRKLANVVIMPDIKGFTANDYTKTNDLAERGYSAAEAHKAELLQYALSQEAWDAYLEHRRSKERGAAGTVMLVKVKAPNEDATEAIERKFQPLVNQPVDTGKIERLLADIRSDGRYDVDYTVGYDSPESNRPILLIAAEDKRTGPPFLEIGANIQAQTAGVTRATLDTIFNWQDLGGYGSGLRVRTDVGFLTRVDGDYYRRLNWAGFFAVPHAGLERRPFYIYNGNTRASERQFQQIGGGFDLGWTDARNQELRGGWMWNRVSWHTSTGSDSLPDYANPSQRVRVLYTYDSEDRALVPRFGIRSASEAGYLYNTANSPSTPYFTSQITLAHTLSQQNTFLLKAEGGSLFNRAVAEPFRFTLGGPLRVSSLAIDQVRGTDYFLVVPGYLRRIAKLPAPLGQSIYFGASYEIGEMRSPDHPTLLHQDFTFGIVAETPLGVLSFAPAFGDSGDRKFSFTLGRLF